MVYDKKQNFGKARCEKRKMIILIVFIFVIGASFGFFLGRLATSAFAVDSQPSEIIEETAIMTPVETVSLMVSEPEIIEAEPIPIYYDVPLDDDLQDYIRELCEERNIDMRIILALIETESSFRADVISKGGDYGLMQINSEYHEYFSEKYGVVDFLDPYENVYCGISIFAEHLDKYQDIHRALMAYNMGATGAKRVWDSGIHSTKYSEKILAIYEKYEERS